MGRRRSGRRYDLDAGSSHRSVPGGSMKINGHSLRDHLRLLLPLLGLIAAVWALRLLLDIAGAPGAVIRLCSTTVAAPVSVLIAVILIHRHRFGSYSAVVLASFLLVL